jgi:hypothetical protein
VFGFPKRGLSRKKASPIDTLIVVNSFRRMAKDENDQQTVQLGAVAGATNAAADPSQRPTQNSAEYIFRAPALMQQAIAKSAGELIFQSTMYRDALLEDYKRMPTGDPKIADKFFSAQRFPLIFARSPSAHVEAWEYVLGLLQNEDEQRYRVMHKGTPFYFAGMASYLGRDFEKALFYMDAALEEDLRLHKTAWPSVPSGKFVLLDSDSPDQFARPLVVRTRDLFEDVIGKISTEGGIGLSVEDLRSKLVYPAMNTTPRKRSAVTGLISFLLEFPSRRKELSLAGTQTSTAEPFFLHLFKGAVLFETLLKTSTVGSTIQVSNPKATIDKFLQDQAIYSAFGFTTAPQGLGGETLDDVFAAIKKDATSGYDYTQRAIRATWGIRNKVGHSMAWPSRPSLEEYNDAFYLIAGALTATLYKLHP